MTNAGNISMPGNSSLSRPRDSWLSTILFLWMVSTFASFRTRELGIGSGEGALDAQALYQIGSWFFIGLIALIRFAHSKAEWPIMFKAGPLRWYLAFVGICFISITYSISPLFSAFYAFQILSLFMLVVASRITVASFIRWIVIYAALNWLLVILGELGITFGFDWIMGASQMYLRYGGSPGEGWRLSSAIGHPSQISVVAAVGAVTLFASSNRTASLARSIMLVFLTVTVLATVSRTAIAGMFVGFLFVIISRRWLHLAMISFGLVIILVLAIPSMLTEVTDFLLRGQSETDFSSLTGRSAIYDVALNRAFGTWWGEGFRALRAVPLMDVTWGQGVAHAHNLLLTAMIETGPLGAMALGICSVSFLTSAVWLAWPRYAGRSYKSLGDTSFLAALGPIFAFSVLDSGFAVNLDPFLVVFISQLVLLQKQKSATRLIILNNLVERRDKKNNGIVPGL